MLVGRWQEERENNVEVSNGEIYIRAIVIVNEIDMHQY